MEILNDCFCTKPMECSFYGRCIEDAKSPQQQGEAAAERFNEKLKEIFKPEEFELNVTVGDGKYTVQQGKDGRLKALRNGEEWRDCCGDGLIYTLAAEVESLREQLKNK